MSNSTVIDRRAFLGKAGTLVVSPMCPALAATETKGKTILLRSGWQTENIGDIAHTPGVLRLLEQRLPGHRVILWGKALERGVDRMLRKRFPRVEIVQGKLDAKTGADNKVLAKTIEQADLLLHGSGPSLVASRDVDAWLEYTKKPYGALGITTQSPTGRVAELLARAAFLFTRETHSLEHLKKAGITAPARGFAPDGTFALDVRDDQRADTFLKMNGLESGRFICVVPRLRFTPYYKFKPGVKWSAEKIRTVEETNARWAERDHAKAREAMIRWVRETGNKVLICPEMTYQLDIMDKLLIDPLPADVRKQVVRRREYWLPDEAASTYARARAVLSFECHSPIIAFANGTPAFYLRQPQDTIKGQMWYDIGVADWVFEIEKTSGKQIADRLMQVHAKRAAAEHYLARAMARVNKQYDVATTRIEQILTSL
jgi:polysaccharide pyruvyl transferase WcaK-like protein